MNCFAKWFQLSLQTIRILSIFFGTWPLFSEEIDGNKHQLSSLLYYWLKLKHWWRKYFLLVGWIFLTTGSHLCYIIHHWIRYTNQKSSKASKYDSIVKKLLTGENWTFNLTAIINLLVTYSTSRRIPGILENLNTNEKRLEPFLAYLSSKKRYHIKLGEVKSLAWFVSIYAVIFLTMVLEYSGMLSLQRDASFVNVILQDLGKLSMMTFDFQFSILCAYLQSLFAEVNNILRVIKNEFDETRNTIIKSKFLIGQNHLHHRQSFQKFLEIENIDNIHRNLCDLVTDIQQTYQIQISLNLGVCFFNTVCVLFITISEYRANTDWMLWISGLLWVTYYVLRVVMVCTSAAQVSDQACAPKTYLSCIDDEFTNELHFRKIENFLLRIAHTDIRFTLCNLLTLNTSLLSSAGLGVTTYLVIALQYSYT